MKYLLCLNIRRFEGSYQHNILLMEICFDSFAFILEIRIFLANVNSVCKHFKIRKSVRDFLSVLKWV